MAEKPVENNPTPEDGENSEDGEKPELYNSQKSLFRDPLPKWLVWPLNSKLPVVPGPENVQFYTTKLGERIIQSYPELDFNLLDPNAYETPTNYEALHDPHLHRMFESRHFREHLLKNELITKDGKVLCDLKNFNKYRRYLDSLYQQLERKELHESRSTQSEGFDSGFCEKPSLKRYSARKQDFHKMRAKVQKKRQQEQTTTDRSGCVILSNSDRGTSGTTEAKGPGVPDKVQQVQERMKNKHKLDKARLHKRLTEDNEKRLKLIKEREKSIADRERVQREQFQTKLNNMKDKQQADRHNKIEKLKQHLDLCDNRANYLVSQKEAKQKEKQKQLKKMWELKKSYQMKEITSKENRDAEAEENRKKRIEQRQKIVQQQQQKHEEELKKSAEKARQRWLRERQDSTPVQQGDEQMLGTDLPPAQFDLTESLITFMEMMKKEEEANKAVKPYPDGEIDYSRRIQGVDPLTMKIYSSLPVQNLLPPDWAPRGVPKDGWWNNDGQGFPKYTLVTNTFDPELAVKSAESIEEAAAQCVQMVTYLSSKVVYPALWRAKFEAARQLELEIRRKQRQEYLRLENERKKREQERKLQAEENKKRKEEMLRKKREAEEKKRVVPKSRTTTPTKKNKAIPTGVTLKSHPAHKRVTQGLQGQHGMARRKSSVRFDMAKTTSIPSSPRAVAIESVSPRVTDSLESELANLHESESDGFDDIEQGGLKVEANDSLTLLRNSKTKLPPEIKPTQFASLLAVEMLETLQTVMAHEDASDMEGLKNHHVTPFTKILVKQSIDTVARKLGIDVPEEKKLSDVKHHYGPIKRGSGYAGSPRDINCKTPATLLTLAVLEAAAKQTGIPFDRAVYASKLGSPTIVTSTTAESSNDIAKRESAPESKPSKETSIVEKAASDTPHTDSRTPLALSAETTISSPLLTELPTSAKVKTATPESAKSEEEKDPAARSEASESVIPKKKSSFLARVSSFLLPKRLSSKSVKNKPSDQESNVADSKKPSKDDEDTKDEVKLLSSSELVDQLVREELSKILHKTQLELTKSDEIKLFSALSSSEVLDQLVRAELKKFLNNAKMELEKREAKTQHVESEVSEAKAELSSSFSSFEVVDQLVRAELSKILYNTKMEMKKSEKIELQHGKKKIMSDTNTLQEVISKQMSRVLLEEQPIQQTLSAQKVDGQISDSKIIEALVNEQITKILAEGNLDLAEQKPKSSKESMSKDSTHAFPAIASAYASETSISIDGLSKHSSTSIPSSFESREIEVKKTQHPVHVAVLKRIASKIEKEEQSRNKRGSSELKKVASSMLKLDSMQVGSSKDYLQAVSELYKYSLRNHPSKCNMETDMEDVLKYNLLTAIQLIREGIMPNPDLTDLISAVVASYLIAHSMLPLSEDTSYNHSTFSQYKGLEVGKETSTPVLIDTLVAEILGDVKQHLRIGTFNAMHIIMAIYGMHRSSMEILEKKESQNLAAKPLRQDVDSSDEEIVAVTEATAVDFVPMFGNKPLDLNEDEASSALIALSIKDPDRVDSGTDAAERNSFYSLVKPDVSRLKTFSNTDGTATEDAAKRHLSSVSMQFKKRSDTKFSSDVQSALMKGVIDYDKLKRGSLPIMGSVKAPETVEEDTDESDTEEPSEKQRAKLRSQSLTLGINVNREGGEGTDAPAETHAKATNGTTKAKSADVVKASSEKSQTKVAKPRGHSKESVSENTPVSSEAHLPVHNSPTAESLRHRESTTSSKSLASRIFASKKSSKKSQISVAKSQSQSTDTQNTPPSSEVQLPIQKSSTAESLRQRQSTVSSKSTSSRKIAPIESVKSSKVSQISVAKSEGQGKETMSAHTPSGSETHSLIQKSSTGGKFQQSQSAASSKSTSSRRIASNESVKSSKKSKISIATASSDTSNKEAIASGSQPLDLDEAEVPPEDPELVRLSARRDKRAQERAAEKRSTELKMKNSGSSSQPTSHVEAASPRQSHASVGTGLTPRPSSAFMSDRTASFQDGDQKVQASGYAREQGVKKENDKCIQVTGNEAAVQTSSSIRQYGRLGSTKAVGSDPLLLWTPPGSEHEYARPAKTPEPLETTSDGAMTAAKAAAKTENQETHMRRPSFEGKKQRPYSGPQDRTSPQPKTEKKQTEAPEGSNNTLVEEIIEYEEITEVAQPQKSKRRLSFVPNFETAVPVIGSYGQQNRRMPYFPGYDQPQEKTRSVLEGSMTPEMSTTPTNRSNYVLDDEDDVSNTSANLSQGTAGNSTNISCYSFKSRKDSAKSKLTSPKSRSSRKSNGSNLGPSA